MKITHMLKIFHVYIQNIRFRGDADAKFPLGKIWNLLQAGSLPNNTSNFCRQMINCMKAWNYIQKISGSPLNIETIKQTHKIMMDNEKHRNGKDILVAGYRKFVCIYRLSYFCTIRPINIQRESHGTVTIGHVGYATHKLLVKVSVTYIIQNLAHDINLF